MTMTRLKFGLLVTSLAGMVTGLTVSGSNGIIDMALPIGAALFGMFLIMVMLGGESALYDREHPDAH